MLAQQASGYDVGGRNFHIEEQPMHENFNFSRASTDESAKLTDQVGSANSLSVATKLARPTILVGQAGSTSRLS